jgi:multicomponent Na+:H+ antiporter subunit B
MTQTVSRLLLAPVLLIALAVLVKGYADVGDGFSAGVIAALGMLLQYLSFGREQAERMLPIRLVPPLAFVGLLLALAVAAFPLLRGDPPLTHLPAPGSEVIHVGTLELISAVAFDIGVFLLVLGAAVGIIHNLAVAVEEDESGAEAEREQAREGDE